MDYLKKYQTETKRNPFCWNVKGEYVRSGSYSDDYVKWLEKQLLQTDVSSAVCECEERTYYEWEKDKNECFKCNKKVYQQTDY